jgi:hypothetical protein
MHKRIPEFEDPGPGKEECPRAVVAAQEEGGDEWVRGRVDRGLAFFKEVVTGFLEGSSGVLFNVFCGCTSFCGVEKVVSFWD